MRRGLLAWSEAETPKAALEARVARVQAAMTAQGMDALLAYTNFPRPASVSYLTHFIPYWNQGLIVMGREGMPTLLMALSNRVRGWALETCHVEDVVCTPRIGVEAAKIVAEFAGTSPKIGVVDAPRLPQGIAEPFRAALGGIELVDATDLYAAARAPADEPEIALTRRAAAIADAALAEGAAGRFDRAAPLIGAVDGAARRAAAEEVQIAVAPDLSAATEFRRFEGDAPLGPTFAVRATVAYKGFWVRRVASLARDGRAPGSWGLAAARFRNAVPSLGNGAELGQRLSVNLGDILEDWHAVGPFGGNPLADLCDASGQYHRIGAGSIVTLGVRLETADGPWIGAGPLLLAEGARKTAEALFA